MLGAVQSWYGGSLLSTRLMGRCRQCHSPSGKSAHSMPLCLASLFGVCTTTSDHSSSRLQIRHSKLKDMNNLDDVFCIASSPERSSALIGVLIVCCALCTCKPVCQENSSCGAHAFCDPVKLKVLFQSSRLVAKPSGTFFTL